MIQGDLRVGPMAARTPVGYSAEATAAAVRAGIVRVQRHPRMVDGAGDELLCAHDEAIEGARSSFERIVALLGAALAEISAKIGSAEPTAGLPVFLALPEARPGFPVTAAKEVADALRVRGARGSVVSACLGHAGFARMVEIACDYVARNQCDPCVVAAADSYLDADTLDWLDDNGMLARADRRGGFIPGEAAAAVVLGSVRGLQSMGLTSDVRVRAVATAVERRSPKSDEGLLGEALSEVLARVSSVGGTGQVDEVYCDINGDRQRTDDWGFAVLRAGSWLRDGSDYRTSVVSMGDVGAATGAVSCILACRAWARDYARGRRALVVGSSMGGLRGAVLLEKGNG